MGRLIQEISLWMGLIFQFRFMAHAFSLTNEVSKHVLEALSDFIHRLSYQVVNVHSLVDTLTEATCLKLGQPRLTVVTDTIAEANTSSIDDKHVKFTLLLVRLFLSIVGLKLLAHVSKSTCALRHVCSNFVY